MKLKHRQWLAALGVLALAVVCAKKHWWPFDASPRTMESFDHPTLWQIVTADRVTVGLFRVGILAIVGFLAVSVPALVLAGRWLKAFGTSSIAADDAEAATEALDEAQEKIQALREELGRVKSQRDTAMAIAEHLP